MPTRRVPGRPRRSGRPVALVLVVLSTLLLVACGPAGQAPEESTDATPSPSAAPGDDTDAPAGDGADGPGPDGDAPDGADPDGTPDTPSPQAEADRDTAGLDRAAWVHLFDDALKSRANIREVVHELADAGAEAIIAEVVRRHDAYYRSEVLPPTPDPTLEPGLDVLAALLEEAEEVGLAVHAWVPAAPTWHGVYDDLPQPDGWVSVEHGRAAPEADRWVSRTVDGTWDEYLDPALPEVQQHLAAVVGELAAAYDVDGVHLDYVRYASERHGYHPRVLARFAEETGATGTPAPDDPDWSQWRREQVTDLVTAAREAVDAAGRDVVFSAAVISWGEGPGGDGVASFEQSRASTEALQPWESWAESGLLDVILPMNYFREDLPDQRAWYRSWLAFQRDLTERTGTPVHPGVAGYLNAPEDAFEQVRLATTTNGGAAMYSYQQPTADFSRGIWEDLAATDWGATG